MRWKGLPIWLKSGLIFFLISLVFYVLGNICLFEFSKTIGMACFLPLLPLGLGLIPSKLLSLLFGSTYPNSTIWPIAGIIINTIIGIFIGLIIQAIKSKLLSKNSNLLN